MPWDSTTALRFGRHIERLRTERGLTQEALAFRSGISSKHIQVLERGYATKAGLEAKTNPTMEYLYLLAEAFDIQPAELLRFE